MSTFTPTLDDFGQSDPILGFKEFFDASVKNTIKEFGEIPVCHDIEGVKDELDYSKTLAKYKEQLTVDTKAGQDYSEKFKELLDRLLVSIAEVNVNEKLLAGHIKKSKKEILDEILAFDLLKHVCWDGVDAEPISQEAIDSAHLFLKSYHGDLDFDAFPDPDGSVGLKADFEKGRVILSFNEVGEVAYLIRKDKPIHRGHSATHKEINKLFSSLL